jgi:hypothetical protein
VFTGLIEHVGKLATRTPRGGGARLRFRALFASPIAIGESISVSGVCLTADAITTDGFEAVDPKLLERVNGAIADIRAGKMVILVDDEDRENEGDLCMAPSSSRPPNHQLHGHARARPHLRDADRGAGRTALLPMMQSPGRAARRSARRSPSASRRATA